MTDRLPRLTARKIILVIEGRDFALARSSGSHHVFKNSAGRRVTVPVHGHKIIHLNVLQSILQDMGISVEYLLEDLGL